MIIKKYSLRLLSVLPVFIVAHWSKKETLPKTDDEGWVGSIRYIHKMYDKGDREEMGVKNEWLFFRRAEIIIIVKGINKKEKNTDNENKEKNIGYAYMTDKLDMWQQHTSPYIKEMKNIQIITEKKKGEGEGEVNVWIEMDKERGTYWLKTDGPQYYVRRKARIWSNIIEMAGGQQPEDTSSGIYDGISIDAPDQKIGSKPNELSGSYVIFSDATTQVTVTWSLRKKCPPWNNPLTQTNINKLEPKVKAAAAKFIKRVNDELCIRLKVAAGYRTDDEQKYEYSKGRTIPGIKVTAANPLGQPVTWAKAGESKHNFGKAIDVYYATDSGIDPDKELAPEIVEIARQEGFEWGGNWKGDKRDPPHFEFRN